MAEIRRPLPPASWTEIHRDPVTGAIVTPPALMEHFDRVRAARRIELRRRYGDPDLGAALAALVRSYGLSKRRVRGRTAWEVVEAWDSPTAAWLRGLSNTSDAWAPLASEVNLCQRAANTQARRIAADAERAVIARAKATGIAYADRDPPARAKALLWLGTSNEAFAYVAVNRWRPRARLAAVSLAELPPLPDDLEDEDEGSRAPTLAPTPEPEEPDGVQP